MGDKAKRKRNWDANGKVKKVVKGSDIYDGGGKVKGDEFKDMVAWLRQYARDMHSWGQDVRDDIVRLEGHAGFATGDPGDPPDGPPNGDESANGDN